jgi:hypothetical protein
MSEDELKRELRELVQLLGNLAQNHAVTLKRHEENLIAAHKAVTNHASAIEDLRTNFREMGQHIIQQDRAITTLQESMLRVLRTLAIDDDSTRSSAPN